MSIDKMGRPSGRPVVLAAALALLLVLLAGGGWLTLQGLQLKANRRAPLHIRPIPSVRV